MPHQLEYPSSPSRSTLIQLPPFRASSSPAKQRRNQQQLLHMPTLQQQQQQQQQQPSTSEVAPSTPNNDSCVLPTTTTGSKINSKTNDILLEGTALKRKSYLSKTFWDERYFILRSNHVLEYYRGVNNSTNTSTNTTNATNTASNTGSYDANLNTNHAGSSATMTIGECRGKFLISHTTGCTISNLYVRKHKSELIYCLTISFTQLPVDDNNSTGIHRNHHHNTDRENDNDDDNDYENDDQSSLGNVSHQQSMNEIQEGNTNILHNSSSSDIAITPKEMKRQQQQQQKAKNKLKLFSSPFTMHRRSDNNNNNNNHYDGQQVSSVRSIDGESITFGGGGSTTQQRRSNLLRHRRPNPLSKRAVSHGTGLVLVNNVNNNNHENNQKMTKSNRSIISNDMDDIPVIPDLVEIPTSHRTVVPPPIISTTTGGGDSTTLLNPTTTGGANNSTTMSTITPVISNNTTRRTTTRRNDDEEVDEEELLRTEYITTQQKDKHKTKDMVIQSSQVAAAVGATVSLTVLTAGVGLVAGLIVLGVAGAAGGAGGAVNALSWYNNKKGKKKNHSTQSHQIIIAFYNYDTAKQWKSILDVALESDIVNKSTWGQLFTSDGRLARVALLPKLRQVSDGDSKLETNKNDGAAGVRLSRRNAKWTLVEGGILSIVGCGYQGLRIYREEQNIKHRKLCPSLKKSFVPPPPQNYASVDGKPCPPMKAHVVLSTSSLDAFLCLMSHGRIAQSKLDRGYDIDMDDDDDIANHNLQESDHRISFEVIESIDEHTDIIRMIYRPMYLFPVWTTPRDFVLFRYWRLDPDGSYVVCYESMIHPKCPPVPNYVRGEMHSVFHIAPQKKSIRKRTSTKQLQPIECMMTATVQVDPKGWVPTIQLSCLSNQAYGDAFSIYALLKLIDIRDAIDEDRFIVAVLTDHPPAKLSFQQQQQLLQHQAHQQQSLPTNLGPLYDQGLSRNVSTDTNDDTLHEDYMDYDYTYAGNESIDHHVVMSEGMTTRSLCVRPPPLTRDKWAEPDSNSFRVRGVHYKHDKLKYNAGISIGRLICVDVVSVDKPLYSGFSLHPTERMQLALQHERELLASGCESDLPPFIFIVNICLPGPPFYHGVYYYAVNDMSAINGMDGTPSSKLCNEFFFGPSDEFRDRTFKLIPQIVQGNFIVRKAVGSTPAIMGKKLRQLYVQNKRFFEVILDCGSSPVATGVIRLSLGYAKSLVVDMGFLFEGDDDEHLPERIFGCVRMKCIEFGPHLRHVTAPPPSSSSYNESPDRRKFD